MNRRTSITLVAVAAILATALWGAGNLLADAIYVWVDPRIRRRS